jgi:Flp pilus assembly protein TadD
MKDLLQQATRLRAAGKLAESADVLARALHHAPQDSRLLHDLGLTLLSLENPAAALTHFDRAIAVDPTFALAHFRRGLALDMLNQPGAVEAYGTAIAQGLQLHEPFSRLARLLQLAGLRDDAARLYRQGAALAPATLPAVVDNAHAALIEGKFAEAQRLFTEALRRQPDLPNIRQHLAHALSAQGHFAAAEAELEHALRDQPQEVGFFYDLVNTRRITRADTPLLDRMRTALAVPAPNEDRIKLRLALAKACDDLADYPAAAAELDHADALRAGIKLFRRDDAIAMTNGVIAMFTPSYMANPHHRSSTSQMPILVVGMPRSGTTLMEQILASHPQMAGAGEVHFWEEQGRAFLQAANPQLGADLRAVALAYQTRLQRDCPGAARIVDKMPFNFRWAPLVHLAFPNARIIHCRRHPADTCLSIMSANLAESETFTTVREDLVVYYRQYQRVTAHARSLLPTASWMDVHYEQLVQNPEQVIRAVLAFCGLAWNDSCLSPERNKRAVTTFSQWQARQPIYRASSGRRHHYGDWLRDFEALEEKEGFLF